MEYNFEHLAYWLLQNTTDLVVKAYELNAVDQLPSVVEGSVAVVMPLPGGELRSGTMNSLALITCLSDTRENLNTVVNKVVTALHDLLNRSQGMEITVNTKQILVGIDTVTAPDYGVDPVNYKHYSKMTVAYYTAHEDYR